MADFDYTWLVLGSLGARQDQVVFDVQVTSQAQETHDGRAYTVVTSVIDTNSPGHSYRQFRRAYWQYGLPKKDEEASFAPLTLYSRVWISKLEEKGVTLVLYAMSPDQKFLDAMTEALIHNVQITESP
ncbi:MAG: hypothetical protein JXO44_03175 [Clostridia bacterium]|nr:hypothetical protein [Clostridia bacterium]